MAHKMNYTSYTLLHKKFTSNVKGYDPLEVDKVLDDIINDLEFYENYVLEAKDYISRLETEIKKNRDEINNLTTEKATLESRLGGIDNDNNVSRENIHLLQRIRLLENKLYEKGVDPNKIK